ncbi:translation initiation factor IF-2-like [Sphaerodactylus townsendi]|uniref:translation initiation factor IF-2-like n=1 Tax=Sphaerodactylus townsendi TaxID=933632 RepID=UPI0020268BCE|nr:translation initiation factor IF-2-like [Sphaerodactylus townsendi]
MLPPPPPPPPWRDRLLPLRSCARRLARPPRPSPQRANRGAVPRPPGQCGAGSARRGRGTSSARLFGPGGPAPSPARGRPALLREGGVGGAGGSPCGRPGRIPTCARQTREPPRGPARPLCWGSAEAEEKPGAQAAALPAGGPGGLEPSCPLAPACSPLTVGRPGTKSPFIGQLNKPRSKGLNRRRWRLESTYLRKAEGLQPRRKGRRHPVQATDGGPLPSWEQLPGDPCLQKQLAQGPVDGPALWLGQLPPEGSQSAAPRRGSA